jgi:hypothetical protein
MERKELIWSGSSSNLAAAMLNGRAPFIVLFVKMKDVEMLFCCVDVR